MTCTTVKKKRKQGLHTPTLKRVVALIRVRASTFFDEGDVPASRVLNDMADLITFHIDVNKPKKRAKKA